MRHRLGTKGFILKAKPGTPPVSLRADLTAAPCNSYFTCSRRRRATSPSWLIRGDETQKWHPRRREARSPVHRVPSASHTPLRVGQDERGSGLWTLWTPWTAARSGERDLAEKLAFTAAVVPESKSLRRQAVRGISDFFSPTVAKLPSMRHDKGF